LVVKLFKYLGILSAVVSYLALLVNHLTHGSFSYETPMFYLAWVTGVISVISNGVYAVKTEVSELALSCYGLVGLFWFAPFFSELEASYGIPSLILFAAFVVYFHLRKN